MNKKAVALVALIVCCLVQGQQSEEVAVGRVLDEWHQDAAAADFEAYFGKMTDDAVFIGTDATEYWKGEAFRAFARPYFERGKAWNFTVLERHIYLNPSGNLAWFDELLDTQMELCRGSGVLKKVGGSWKIAHYVLSIAVPNDKVPALIDLKKETDSLLKKKLRSN